MSKVYRFTTPAGNYDVSVIGKELNIQAIDDAPTIMQEGVKFLILSKLCELMDRMEALETINGRVDKIESEMVV